METTRRSRPGAGGEPPGLSRQVARALRLTALAALCAGAVVLVASLAMFLTTAPPVASLLFEPLSLLLVPGLLLAVVVANPHDYSMGFVLAASAVLYFVLFEVIFWRLARRGG